jgi:hypothetical protein
VWLVVRKGGCQGPGLCVPQQTTFAARGAAPVGVGSE